MARKRKQRTRGTSPHPGVKMFARKLSSGTVRHFARCLDPRSPLRKFQEVSLDALGLRNESARRDWAIRRSKQIQEERAAYATFGAVPAKSGGSVREIIDGYLESRSADLSAVTIAGYKDVLRTFKAWAESVKLTDIASLTPALLANFNDLLVRGKLQGTPKVAGKSGKRNPVSVNRWLRETKAFLNFLANRGQLPHLDEIKIKRALPRLKEPKPRPEFLRPPEIKKLLEACARHDGECFNMTRAEKSGETEAGTSLRYQAIRPFVLASLLTGARNAELRGARCDRLHVAGPDRGELILDAEDTKTRRERSIDLSVCPSMITLLSQLKLQQGEKPYLFGGNEPLPRYFVENSRRRLIRDYGAPPFTWQGLRATCATYLANAPGIFAAASAYREAAQLGHSVTVAERNYVGLYRDILPSARTLEEAMGISDNLAGLFQIRMDLPLVVDHKAL